MRDSSKRKIGYKVNRGVFMWEWMCGIFFLFFFNSHFHFNNWKKFYVIGGLDYIFFIEDQRLPPSGKYCVYTCSLYNIIEQEALLEQNKTQ